MIFILLLMLLGLIPAWIAQTKGRSAFLWWLYGAALFIIALPHALLLSSSNDMCDHTTAKRIACLHCLEDIDPRADTCPFCRRRV